MNAEQLTVLMLPRSNVPIACHERSEGFKGFLVPSFLLSQTFRLAKGESPSSTPTLQDCKLKSPNSVLRDSEEKLHN
jgi:hypothetical protein